MKRYNSNGIRVLLAFESLNIRLEIVLMGKLKTNYTKVKTVNERNAL